MRRITASAALVMLIASTAPAANSPAESLKPLPQAKWDRASAAHLLRRAGFGGTPEQVEALAVKTLEEAVDSLVDYESLPFAIAPPPFDAELHEPRSDERLRLRGLSEDERRKAMQELRQKGRQAFEETRLWWLDRMVTTPRPLEEKMTLFWHGLFTSGMREVRNPVYMQEQNELYRRHATGNFGDLVLAVSRDRAMLVYLDGFRNRKQQPNENYGRELLELFTLGEGNYAESDIKAAARAFTGWGFNDDGFEYRHRQHDDGMKVFLGQKGRWGGEDIIDIILDQDQCARHLARKLLEHFCRPDPPKPLVYSLAREIKRQDYDLKPVLKTLFKSRAFYHEDARGCLVKSPVELVVGSARQFGLPVNNLTAAQFAITAMGQELLQPPNVKGWDGGESWVNTATLFQRYNTVSVLINGDQQSEGRDRRMMQRKRAEPDNDETEPAMRDGARSRREPGDQPPFEPIPWIKRANLKDADEVVRYFAEQLLAVPLADAKREQLCAYLRGNPDDFDLDGRDAARRIRVTISLLCSTPEFQMY